MPPRKFVHVGALLIMNLSYYTFQRDVTHLHRRPDEAVATCKGAEVFASYHTGG